MTGTDVYLRARARARRTATFRLRGQERRIVARARRGAPSAGDLARLAAIRSELLARRATQR